MKKRILFVDDEVNILKGLKRSLRPERKQWDMAFAEGGQNALELLEKETFDVVVSDMRMPQMDGAALLQIIQNKYPKLVRIILSGYSDQEMVMKSVKSAHQYLSKPCETPVLISAINRACSLRDFINKPVLQQLLGGLETIPSLPSLYLQVIEEVNSPDASVAKVGDIISQDIGMTAKILQMVNSSFFGMKRHISDVMDAVTFLGLDVVKTLVLGIEVFSKLNKNTLAVMRVDDIQDHSIRTANIAKQIATCEKMDMEMVENAMMASMLHDLGKLLLCEHFHGQYEQVLSLIKTKELDALDAEKQVFGVSHAQVGGYILGLWGLPDNIVEGIAFHHEPAALGINSLELCGVVHAADRLEHHHRLRRDPSDTVHGLDIQYIRSLDLENRLPVWQQTLETI